METRSIMKKYGIRPDKSLGQHFLIDKAPINSMLLAAGLEPDDEVLEIGPGLGVLTVKLCENAKKVVAVEKDRDFIPVLKDITRQFKNICVINEDVLKLNIEKLRESQFTSAFKVIANLPYYITSPIIMKIIQNRHLIKVAVIMIQKEVAQRLTALPGKKDYGILSIAVQLYANVDIICEVGSEAFMPPPKVNSAVVRIVPEQEPRVKIEDEAFYFKVVEAAFGERRKTIKNSLKRRLTLPYLPKGAIEKALSAAGIDPLRRGETLSIEEYAVLSRAIARESQRD
jgi:16S rRNA (adenine1518-N6/adenine1519-N6)-dimethyltransferase